MMNKDDVMREALLLPIPDRVALLEQLQGSLGGAVDDSVEGGVDPEIQAAWREEIERRVQSLDAGTAETHDLEEVLTQIERKLAS